MTTKEQFLELKKQAVNSYIDLALPSFDESFNQIQNLFDYFSFAIENISILSNTEDQLRLKAFSTDFLFSKTLFKNESVLIDIEFTLVDDKIELLAICKLNKASSKLSDLPGVIGDLLKPLDFLEISDLVYIITTRDLLTINTDVFPEYNAKSVNLKPGINLAGFINLKNSGNVVSLITQPLGPIVGEGPYFMSWNMKNEIDIDFSLKLPKDIDIENLFTLKEPALIIKPVYPAQVSLDGLFEIQLPPSIKVSVFGEFSYAIDGVRGKFNLDNVAEKVPAPFGYPGIHLTTLSVLAGVSNGIANVGAEGSFYIGPDKPDSLKTKSKVSKFGIASNQYKFIFDAIPGKITPKFFYMYLDKLTLEEYIKALSNKEVNLPAFLDKIAIEQLMFHWCETPTGEPKPDGTIGMPVFGLSGITNLFGHRTFTELNVNISNDSNGKLVADPIDIGDGLLKITGNGKGTPEKYKGATKVKPGGMEFAFNSTGNPFFLSFSTKIEILGISGEIEGEVKENGIIGSVKSSIPGIIKNELKLNLNESDFEVETSIYAGISGLRISMGKLGTLKLDTYLEGGFNAQYLNGRYSNKMNLHFMLLGINFDLGELEIEVLDLKKIVKILEDEISRAVQKLADDILAWLTATIEELIEFVGDKLEQIGKALNETYQKTLEDGAKLMKQVGYQALQVGEALQKGYDRTGQEIVNALKSAGYLAEEAGEVLKDVLKSSGDAAAQVLRTAGYATDEIGRTLKTVYGFQETQIVEILKAIGSTAAEIGNFLKNVSNFSAQKTTEILSTLTYSNDVIAQTLKGIGFDVSNVGEALISVLKLPEDAAKEILGKIGFSAPEIEIKFPYIKAPEIYIKVPEVYIKPPYIKF
ncbi:hypothetical protein HNP24_001805 [Chryseobacterium sediminis]|uniref:Uncharacterized protein n=1 Tax=Chryseobacterium sediminis TaxID=1679494 RepID=A0ABR6PYT9_9FLAO|nr:phage tail tape measure protein [Chryseobacterium sediminis]MBB6330855.1 hypothetical protein [Chryseobacterium sediminis]